jgi:hypothetical protein
MKYRVKVCCVTITLWAKSGWRGRDRTFDRLINSQLLLPLSYTPIEKSDTTELPAGSQHSLEVRFA